MPNPEVEEVIENIIEHHGVKGMKWGVRRNRPSAVTVSDKGKKLKTSGGHGLPAHSDAIPARVVGQKIKKSGMKSVSDAELQAYAKRIQMEQNISRLMYNEKSGGARFVDGLLGRQGSRLANEATKSGGAKAGRTAVRYATKKSRKVAKVATAVAIA